MNFTSKKCEVTLQSTNATCLSLILIFLHWLERFHEKWRRNSERRRWVVDESNLLKNRMHSYMLARSNEKNGFNVCFQNSEKSWCVNLKVYVLGRFVSSLWLSIYAFCHELGKVLGTIAAIFLNFDFIFHF